MVSQLRTGANLVVSQIQEIGNPYNEQKKEINRRRNQWKLDLSLTCVPLKSSNWLMKLKFTQLPAINDSENLILESSLNLYWNHKIRFHHAPTCLFREINLLCYQNHNCSNCKLKTIKSPLTCWRGY